MDLKDFVSKTLSQIVEGIKEVQAGQTDVESSGRIAGRVNPPLMTAPGGLERKGVWVTDLEIPVEFVEFDIAVTAEETAGAEAGVKVLGLSIAGDLGGKLGTVSRVRFRVPIEWPRP